MYLHARNHGFRLTDLQRVLILGVCKAGLCKANLLQAHVLQYPRSLQIHYAASFGKPKRLVRMTQKIPCSRAGLYFNLHIEKIKVKTNIGSRFPFYTCSRILAFFFKIANTISSWRQDNEVWFSTDSKWQFKIIIICTEFLLLKL